MTALLLVLLVLLCCFVHISMQQSSGERPKDCNKEKGSCGANGTCKSDGICQCKRGYRGQTCSIGPPPLRPGFKVPGQIDETRPEAFFSVQPDEFSTDTKITVDVVGSNPLPINVFMSIGVMPTGQIHQFKITDSTLVEFQIPTLDLAQAAPMGAEPRLFIVVQAANSAKDKIPFSIRTSGLGSLVPGLPDAALYAIIAVGSLCCIALVVVIVFLIFRVVVGGGGGGGGGKPKKMSQQQQQQQQQMMMQQQQHSGVWAGSGPQLTADYPSSTIQMQQMGTAQQQMQQGYAQQQASYGSTMQQGYGGGNANGSASSFQQQQQYGGSATGYPSATTSTELGRGQSSSFVDAQSYHEDPQMQPLW